MKFLINTAITYSQSSRTDQTTNIGYGLIGAYVIVFVGIAVRINTFPWICLFTYLLAS